MTNENIAPETDDYDPRAEFNNRSGSFGCHEVLHMASFLCDAVHRELVEHPAIELNPKWLALASKAGDALSDLYQEIGAAHLNDDDTPVVANNHD